MKAPSPRALGRGLWRNLPIVALGGLSALGFAPHDIWPATFVAFALWMGLVARAPGRGRAMAIGWWFGLGHFIIGNDWIATAFRYQEAMPAWLGWIAVSLLALYLALFPSVAAGLAWRWGRANPIAFPLIFASAWIVTEWLRATLFTGYAWNPLGVIWVALPADVALPVRWIGTYGASGMVILAAGAGGLLVARKWLAALLVLVPMPLAGLLAAALEPVGQADAAGPRVRIVQPNIGQQDKWRPGFENRNFARLARLTGQSGATPRLILWPEAAVPDYLEDEPWARRRIARLLGPRDVVMTGGVAIVWNRQGRAVAARNSMFAMDGGGRLLARYDKAHLVPFGEYLPMRPILSAIGLSRLAPGDLDFLPGSGPSSYAIPGFGRVGVQICYEIIFSGQVVDRRNRPDFLFNPSNDAWFGPSGPPQHLAQARLRAIEEGIPIIRATPTGISAVIDARGRILHSVPWRTAGAIESALPKPAAPTPFSRFGNILSFALAFLLALAGVACHRRSR